MMKKGILFALFVLVRFAIHPAFGQTASDPKMTKRDQIKIAVQEICPVSGGKLGKQPIKVRIGKDKEEIYLCCRSCMKGKLDPKHWATIHANFARAQGICPVMKQSLPKKPKWTFVNGQIIYVCCAPCTKKIAKDPKRTLAQVDKLYIASLKSKETRR